MIIPHGGEIRVTSNQAVDFNLCSVHLKGPFLKCSLKLVVQGPLGKSTMAKKMFQIVFVQFGPSFKSKVQGLDQIITLKCLKEWGTKKL